MRRIVADRAAWEARVFAELQWWAERPVGQRLTAGEMADRGAWRAAQAERAHSLAELRAHLWVAAWWYIGAALATDALAFNHLPTEREHFRLLHVAAVRWESARLVLDTMPAEVPRLVPIRPEAEACERRVMEHRSLLNVLGGGL